MKIAAKPAKKPSRRPEMILVTLVSFFLDASWDKR